MDPIGAIVIGRNEGERLRRCLASVTAAASRVVYVDSHSSDGSVELARSMGVRVVELDMSIPFSAARARNAGYAALIEADPAVRFVQFIDGDCELTPDWLAGAADVLGQRPELAIVAGWLHERFPEASIYNRLGEMEWNHAQPGEVDSVGGIFMVRREAFDAVGGFDPTVMAGEEPELCQRLRHKGWKIARLDRDMARHDLAMVRFGQWWRRQVRTGYSGADVADRFRIEFFRRNKLRVIFWSMVWPLAIVAAGLVAGRLLGAIAGWGAALLVLMLWPAQVLRIAVRARKRGQPGRVALAYGWFTMLSFLPQAVGLLRYQADRAAGRSARLIEYKSPIRPIMVRAPRRPPKFPPRT